MIKKGSLVPGKDGDIVIFDDNIKIQTTIIKGKVAYNRNIRKKMVKKLRVRRSKQIGNGSLKSIDDILLLPQACYRPVENFQIHSNHHQFFLARVEF